MTHTGALVGTPEYMSPEQAKGEKLDARSDLFSVGIIFYELLTGDTPYKADTEMASLYKRTLEKVPPPIELVPETPESGGREGIRTPGLLVANEALSQLSYSPTSSREILANAEREAKRVCDLRPFRTERVSHLQ